MMRAGALAMVAAALLMPATPQTQSTNQGAHRMEVGLERLDGTTWRSIDPALVLAQGDHVRFRFRTNFDGYLYVMNQSTSGKYEQLFPREETGQDNRILAAHDYKVPAASVAFRIAGPPGQEVVYWLVTPAKLAGPPPHPALPPSRPLAPQSLIPRCDDTVLKARGDCIDHSAGPKLAPGGEELPPNLPTGSASRDLLFMRQKDLAVISSPEPLAGPVIYEFRLAHR